MSIFRAKDEIVGLRALLVRYNQENRSGGGSPRPDSGAGSEVETDTDRLPDISTQLCLLKTIKQLKNLLWATGKELYKLHADSKAQDYLDVSVSFSNRQNQLANCLLSFNRPVAVDSKPGGVRIWYSFIRPVLVIHEASGEILPFVSLQRCQLTM